MKNAMVDTPAKGEKTTPVDHRKQDRITLKKVKYFAAQSEETHCYAADLYFDGRKIGTVGNRGHGGCDDIRIDNKADIAALREYTATFDAVTWGDDSSHSYQPDLESVCCELVNQWLTANDLKKILRKRVLLSRDGAILQTAVAPNAAHRDALAQLYASKGETVLNLLPFDQALALYCREVGA